MRSLNAAVAYRDSARFRSVREQEADLFLRVNAVLRGAMAGDDLIKTKALADNERLWSAVLDTLRHPQNELPRTLRASVISVGMAVQRENRAEQPDFPFLIGINQRLAAGLSGV